MVWIWCTNWSVKNSFSLLMFYWPSDMNSPTKVLTLFGVSGTSIAKGPFRDQLSYQKLLDPEFTCQTIWFSSISLTLSIWFQAWEFPGANFFEIKWDLTEYLLLMKLAQRDDMDLILHHLFIANMLLMSSIFLIPLPPSSIRRARWFRNSNDTSCVPLRYPRKN